MSDSGQPRRTHIAVGDEDNFLMWIGKCITAWAEIEDRLFNIFWHSIGSSREHAAIIYYKTPSVNARLSLVDEIVQSILPKKEKKSGAHDHPDTKFWKGVVKDINTQMGLRRRIAHHPLMLSVTFPDEDDWLLDDGDDEAAASSDPAEIKMWFEVSASDSERLRGKDDEVEPIQLQHLQEHFAALAAFRPPLVNFLRTTLAERLKERAPPDLPQSKD